MIEDAAATVGGDPDRGRGVGSMSSGDEPVELLVQLAEDGSIDPWDIDIVSVTDAYLEKLDTVDLRVSGRALFYASVLLRMKSDVLLEPEQPEAEPMGPPTPDGWDHDDGSFQPDPIADLENEMDRRLDRKRARGKPETLDELVRELRDIERRRWWKPHREYDTSNSPSGFQRGTQTVEYRGGDDLRLEDEPTESEVTGATHTEDIDSLIDRVWAALSEQFEAGRAEVLFAEIAGVGGSRVQTYLGLLFLAHRDRVSLEQDALFGDLWIAAPGSMSSTD